MTSLHAYETRLLSSQLSKTPKIGKIYTVRQ